MTPTLSPVADLEQRRWHAVVSADLDELDRLFGDDLSYTHSNGMVDPKQSYLGALPDGAFWYVDIDVAEPTLRKSGRTVAVTGIATATSGSSHGRVVSPLRDTGVWSEHDSEWRFVAWHSWLVPA